MTDWHKRALCAQIGGDLWFPEVDSPQTDTAQAKKICAICPVREPCRIAGMDEEHGIWGGLGTKMRRKMRRQQA